MRLHLFCFHYIWWERSCQIEWEKEIGNFHRKPFLYLRYYLTSLFRSVTIVKYWVDKSTQNSKDEVITVEPVEVRDMLYILAVCEERSFSRAAEKYYISQPALSKIVKRVEGNLGTQIFDRGSVPLRVTPEGEVFVEYFRKMQDIQREIELYCDEMRRHRKSDLNIGGPSFFCTYVLPPLTAAFKMENPAVNIKLIETNDSDLRKFLSAGIVDLGLSVEPNMPSHFDSFVLKKENIILAVPSALPVNRELESYAISYDDIRSGRFITPEIPGVPMERFAKENFLLLKRGNDMHRRGLKICQDAGFEPNIVMEMDQLLSAYYLAGTGSGITFIRASIPYYVGPSDDLIFYKIDHPDTNRELRAYFRSGECTALQKTFIEYLRNSSMPG